MDDIKQRDPMPDADASLEAIIAFWDTHSTADYADEMEAVEIEFAVTDEQFVVRLVPEWATLIGRRAKARGVSTQTLVNLWLAEKAHQTPLAVSG